MFQPSNSSIGMAKAALEAVNGVNLFGDQGASWSVVFGDIDAHNRNRTIFESILPRESNSKVRKLLQHCYTLLMLMKATNMVKNIFCIHEYNTWLKGAK